MKITLREARDEARRFRRNGDHPHALRAYQRILAALPLDYETRLAIADVLAEAGQTDAAAEVYRSVAIHNVRAGHPLPAIVAAYALGKLGQPVDDIFALLVKTYASGSPLLARFAVRTAPVDPSTVLEVGDIGQTSSLAHVMEQARKTALDLSVFVGYQEQYHPLPFLSELGPESLGAVLRSLTVLRLTDGQLVVRQGDAGDTLFLVADGELRVFVNTPAGDKDVARLFENTLFGEMALITGQPRTASVAAAGDADVIGVSKAALALVIVKLPTIRAALDQFSRERLIKNLLQTSPLFVPFNKSQQGELLRHFEGHEVEAGTELIREGERGKGLFLVLAGEVEVVARADTPEAVSLARLKPGDIFGEMSLVTDQPTSATVRAIVRSSVLFLAREYVERLAEAIPQVQAYFEQVALNRARDNTMRLDRGALPSEAIEVDLSDVVLV
ncbi:MAG TPA: cyclic nucleotide-binding domain-containing protein [Polyangia bacterium]|nr:cyclic nucleotide-binding domain-containing protein [Polyangia bacterium]